MTNCNDCIHEQACDQSSRQLWAMMAGELDCTDFKDRQNFVEVLRCKGCDYYEKEHRGFGFCKYFDIGRADNDFCSSCIRRDGE